MTKLALCVSFAAATMLACSGEAPQEDAAEPASELLTAGTPLACADPTVFSTKAHGATWFVFCTGMSHVWKTTDWTTFTDEHDAMTFDFGDMPARSKAVGSWWAPSVTYDAAHDRYVMWVSVIDNQPFADMTRSLGVLSAPTPLGPWKYERTARNATANGQNTIDPMLFHAKSGRHYVYWKQYGGGLDSRIMGAELDDSLTTIAPGTPTAIMDGFDSNSWELNVRENPAVWENPSTGVFHLLYSGAHWRDDSYATGHAESTCGPLCGWQIKPSTDRGVAQVVQAKGDKSFASGGPGGAVWVGNAGDAIVYAAASRSAQGDTKRYLHRDPIHWANGRPFVDNAHHHPKGF